MGGKNYKDRWHLLYKEFNAKYHIDIKRRVENFVKKTGKNISKLDYIEQELGKLQELYNIACKLFEGDIEKIISEYRHVCSKQ
jgi:hypothetical protein